MNLAQVQADWDQLGKKAPLRSMLPASVCGKIRKIDEYFAFGKTQTGEMMSFLTSLGICLGSRRAVDFGCGLGRSTQALSEYFEEVHGIDIAPSILELARAYNQHPQKCRYVLNGTDDLMMFEDRSVDFICSFGTLQHVAPRIFEKYIREFMRILVPDGVLLFNMPSVPKKTVKGLILGLTPTWVINLYRRNKYGRETYPIRQEEVIRIIKAAEGTVVDSRIEEVHNFADYWTSIQYCVKKWGPGTGVDRYDPSPNGPLPGTTVGRRV
ncbi:class I SAM-dependent methyltransferase [Nitrospira sp. Nam80]